ncbi:unnamed protein product [Amoebophrya sp. A25]|nr:unnamed protein product [Amoebophrya sp. A25]|eukprot:GSA25T00023462001.1
MAPKMLNMVNYEENLRNRARHLSLDAVALGLRILGEHQDALIAEAGGYKAIEALGQACYTGKTCASSLDADLGDLSLPEFHEILASICKERQTNVEQKVTDGIQIEYFLKSLGVKEPKTKKLPAAKNQRATAKALRSEFLAVVLKLRYSELPDAAGVCMIAAGEMFLQSLKQLNPNTSMPQLALGNGPSFARVSADGLGGAICGGAMDSLQNRASVAGSGGASAAGSLQDMMARAFGVSTGGCSASGARNSVPEEVTQLSTGALALPDFPATPAVAAATSSSSSSSSSSTAVPPAPPAAPAAEEVEEVPEENKKPMKMARKGNAKK